MKMLIMADRAVISVMLWDEVSLVLDQCLRPGQCCTEVKQWR